MSENSIPQHFNLTPKRLNILQLAATGAIPAWAHRRFKPGPRRVLRTLETVGLIELNAYGDYVATTCGQRVYETAVSNA